ncbi:hypothetical protein [Pseudohaliea sp.]|uniref:hypothetical protein n=1 Tax=Pseudohaliea sp. TaxID=2740289 RepID=UPI0032EE03F4
MNRRRSRRQAIALPALCLALLALALQPSARAADDGSEDVMQAVEGLWAYTDLVTRDGQSLPLTGIFLFKDGTFLQQSIFNGEPFEAQGAMAHAGPYWPGGAGLRMTSDPTLSLDPGSKAPLTSTGVLEHDIAVRRDGEELVIQFGGGTSTVQSFRRLGDAADAALYPLEHGVFALVDGHFILVSGNAERAVTGYGTYERDGDALTLAITRWAESDGEQVTNRRDTTLAATFDGTALALPGGQRLAVVAKGDAAP